MRLSFTNLTLDERRVIFQMLQSGATKTSIAQTLGRDRSTITREIKRNFCVARKTELFGDCLRSVELNTVTLSIIDR